MYKQPIPAGEHLVHRGTAEHHEHQGHWRATIGRVGQHPISQRASVGETGWITVHLLKPAALPFAE